MARNLSITIKLISMFLALAIIPLQGPSYARDFLRPKSLNQTPEVSGELKGAMHGDARKNAADVEAQFMETGLSRILNGKTVTGRDGNKYKIEVVKDYFDKADVCLYSLGSGGKKTLASQVMLNTRLTDAGNINVEIALFTRPAFESRGLASLLMEEIAAVAPAGMSFFGEIENAETLLQLNSLLPEEFRGAEIAAILARFYFTGMDKKKLDGLSRNHLEMLKNNIFLALDRGYRFRASDIAKTVLGKVLGKLGDDIRIEAYQDPLEACATIDICVTAVACQEKPGR